MTDSKSSMSPGQPTPQVRTTASFFPAGSSLQIPVDLALGDSWIRISAPGLERTESSGKCSISDPLGTLPRHIQLPDNSRITVTDLPALASWEKLHQRTSGMHQINRLESLKLGVVLCFLLLIGFGIFTYFVAVPKAADVVAARIPDSINEALTKQSLATLRLLLSTDETTLSQEDQEQYAAHFRDIVDYFELDAQKTNLIFLNASMANAFALPDGTVCITDELIESADDELQVIGVLAHELVHVRERHAMRMVLQNTTMLLLWALITGDIASTSNLGAALPIMLAESSYSRRFEFEADRGAGHYMIHKGWGTEPLQSMLTKLDVLYEEKDGDQIFEKMSSHPLTRKRIDELRKLDELRNESEGS